MKSIIVLMAFSLFATGCASRHTLHERGWVGGSYARAIPATKIFFSADSGPVVRGLPQNVFDQQKSAILITDLDPETPLQKSGCREGDLILAVNQKPIKTIREYFSTIDQSMPGSSLQFTLCRDGVITNQQVTIGQEQFKNIGLFTFGLSASTHLEFDLFPDPNFSLVALGYDRGQDRLNLHSAESRYLASLQAQTKTNDPGRQSPEGWRAWLGPLSLAHYRWIISQKLAEPLVAQK